MQRLQPQTLGQLQAAVRHPGYDRAQLRAGILHFGIGAFHRAHQAVYTDAALAAAGGDWGIIGVSLRSDAVAQQLDPQQGLYSVLAEDGEHAEIQVIGAVLRVLVATREREAVVAAIADPSIHIITLTITEKGYALAADGETLNVAEPTIRADLAAPESPGSAIGLLALGLRTRQQQGGAPLTILSCDNLARNSHKLRAVLGDYLRLAFPDVLPWLAQSVRFPCSVVDRIVPAMTAAARAHQSQLLGLDDAGAVATEPFSQWVIENDFATGRPAWEVAGARFVTDVEPYEAIKLRLLNASHSAIAWCGLLTGCATVDAVMADPALRGYIERLMTQELMLRLSAPSGFDLDSYRDALLQRFANPRLAHRCAQIAMDSSEKIAQRWLPALQSGPAPLLCRALGAWCHAVLCTDIALDDPRAAQLLAWRESEAPMGVRIEGVLANARITADTVPEFAGVCAAVEAELTVLRTQGRFPLQF